MNLNLPVALRRQFRLGLAALVDEVELVVEQGDSVRLVEGDVNEPEVPYVLLAYDAARHFGPLVVGVGGLQGLSMLTPWGHAS